MLYSKLSESEFSELKIKQNNTIREIVNHYNSVNSKIQRILIQRLILTILQRGYF